MIWYLEVLRKYAVFSGRARRKEFWMFTLVNVIVTMVLVSFDLMLSLGTGVVLGIFSGVYGLATLVPSLAVYVRRLHDTGRSGWWILLSFVPIAGLITLFIFTVWGGDPGVNKYGPNPKTSGPAPPQPMAQAAPSA